MRICFIADARSPIARNWIQWFVQRGHTVCVISSYPAPADSIPGAEVHCVSLYVNRFAKIRHNGSTGSNGSSSFLSPLLAELRTGRLSQWFHEMKDSVAPMELQFHVKQYKEVLESFQPEIVHAMRIPYEGMMAAAAVEQFPLVISIWGNDLTLHAAASRLSAKLTRRSLERADALHSDCRRDIRLASSDWGFDASKPTAVLPGGGGIQMDRFAPGTPDPQLCRELNIPPNSPVIINPRGFRPGSVRSDTFFRAIPVVLRSRPDTVVIALGMAKNPIAQRWVDSYGIGQSVRLLGSVSRERMAALFRLSWISVSISEHDGLPNTLLESLACGAFPVVGDIESIREWIDDGVNGFLVSPGDADAAAAAILRAIEDKQLRRTAAAMNRAMIEARADHSKVMPQAESFYKKVVASHGEARLSLGAVAR